MEARPVRTGNGNKTKTERHGSCYSNQMRRETKAQECLGEGFNHFDSWPSTDKFHQATLTGGYSSIYMKLLAKKLLEDQS